MKNEIEITLSDIKEMFDIIQNRVITMERRILILEGKTDNRILIDKKYRRKELTE